MATWHRLGAKDELGISTTACRTRSSRELVERAVDFWKVLDQNRGVEERGI